MLFMGVKVAQSLVIFQKSQIYFTKMGVARAWSVKIRDKQFLLKLLRNSG